MSKALAYVEEVTFFFMQHTTRGEWQAKKIDEIIETVSDT